MKYPEYVYEAVTERLECSQTEVDEMPREDVFENLVAWELGYSSWADTIKTWIRDIHKIELISE